MAMILFSFCYTDSLVVVGISICTTFLWEGISWILIYRTSTYKSLCSLIDKASKKLESMKSTSSSSASGVIEALASSSKKPLSRAKKMDQVKTSLKESTRDLSLSKFKSNIIVVVILFVALGLLNSLFEGWSVAKLPFLAIPLVLKMSHQGLLGIDPTDCSMMFLYFLCSISIRTNLQKFLRFSTARGATRAELFPMHDPKTN